ncbi:MAG: NTP transferase domain-containing protein [Phycisphaerales bacterium]
MSGLSAIILAAGKGTRMKSELPKVAVPALGEPMVRWVVRACREAGCDRIVLVVGYKQEVVREIFSGDDVEFAVQAEQLGTGHAVNAAEPLFRGAERAGEALVLAGDGPLINPKTLRSLVEKHRAHKAAATLATTTIEDPTGYGRIVRDGQGRFSCIVEEKNATAEQKAIREVYPSICCFDVGALFETLAELPRDGVTGEYYVTKVPEMLGAKGRVVETVSGVPAEEALGVNTVEQLADVERVLASRGKERTRA